MSLMEGESMVKIVIYLGRVHFCSIDDGKGKLKTEQMKSKMC
jgi:hypothetical protein